MAQLERIQIPPLTAISMVGQYIRRRVGEQFRAVIFIVLYLVAFKILIIGTPPANAWSIAVGLVLLVFGLTFFLEGLILGLMPLGERVGLKLPQRTGLIVIAIFGLLLGIGSTLAEPAVAALRAMGGSVKAWEAPLLFSLLGHESDKLVIAIGIGVGAAVATGMLRLYFGISIKPFVYGMIPVLLLVSVYCAHDPNLVAILGLAWDAGAVTTGAVTVPLVLALGIGVARSLGKRDSGFGIIALASGFPVLTVLLLGIGLNPRMPEGMPEDAFFDANNRPQALSLFQSETALNQYAWQHGSYRARQQLYPDAHAYQAAVVALNQPETRRNTLGTLSLSDWLRDRASEEERRWFLHSSPVETGRTPHETIREQRGQVWMQELLGSLRSVVPLVLLLLLALFFYLRDRLRYHDELALGIILCLLGMTMLTTGIRTGLAPLGDEIGRALPRAIQTAAIETERMVLSAFDRSHVLHEYDAQAETSTAFFYLRETSGKVNRAPFDPERYDEETGQYEHIVRRTPLFGPGLLIAGYAVALLFAFGLGYGSTLAEPALSALGMKVEEISVGTIKRSGVVYAVSIGVGLGLIAGLLRILYNLPTLWMIVPPYVLLVWLTYRSDADFAGVAWDCGGVTTGVVTVPLVMAMGLGIGDSLNIVDGFGMLAMASAYPILTVLLYGLLMQARQRRNMRDTDAHD